MDENTIPVEKSKTLLDTTVDDVKTLLNEHFPNHISFGYGSFTISRGSSQIMIIVRPFTLDETCIELFAHVVTGATINEELLKFLMRKNAELHFGAFGLLFDGTITFSHSILGSNLDPNELVITLNSVAVISDYYDDIIVDMAGGKRALDMVYDDAI
ncbi:MAG: hypothetical protein NT007_09230 [Candidatus Kapabacteria bacterium]|nr:hypothetical protein [Candidatus Kapabacteria bacterium]